MRRWTSLLTALLVAGSASGQTQGPVPAGGAPTAADAPKAHRFELAFVYGLAAFTGQHGDVNWYGGAPTSGHMDLETSATLGADLAWAASGHVRLGARATRQATRLVVTDEAGATTRTDLTLLHLLLELELALGGGAVQPVLTLGGGGTQARAENGSGESWHGMGVAGLGVRAAVHPRWALRALVRVPLIWAGGDPVPQVEAAVGAAFLF